MELNKQYFDRDATPTVNEACICKQIEYWTFRIWLPKANEQILRYPIKHSKTNNVNFNRGVVQNEQFYITAIEPRGKLAKGESSER